MTDETGRKLTIMSQIQRKSQGQRCRKCGGLLVDEDVFALHDEETDFLSQRCIQCGNVVDPVILQNRSQCKKSP